MHALIVTALAGLATTLGGMAAVMLVFLFALLLFGAVTAGFGEVLLHL